jgi:ABC-type branched-subunit amino acid transport system substrate-binding protein
VEAVDTVSMIRRGNLSRPARRSNATIVAISMNSDRTREVPRGSRRAIIISLASLMVVAAGCEAAEQPVVFGLAGPLQTEYGASMREGAELARRDINQAGGIRNRLLEFRAVDDAANPDSAMRVAETLFQDAEVVAVVGHVNSGTTVQAAGSYQRGLPAVATSATSPEISRLGEWIFRVAPSDSANSVELARFAHRLGLATGVLYENEDYAGVSRRDSARQCWRWAARWSRWTPISLPRPICLRTWSA